MSMDTVILALDMDFTQAIFMYMCFTYTQYWYYLTGFTDKNFAVLRYSSESAKKGGSLRLKTAKPSHE